MPDQKLTQLPVLAALSADDIFYVVDDPAGAASSRQVAVSVFDARYLQTANNLSDLTNAVVARTSLGLGTLATVNDAPADGTIYGRQNNAWAGASGILPVVDTTAIVKGSVTDTKLLRFEVDGFTAATTRVITPPDADITLAGQNYANIFTADQTITGSNLYFDNNKSIFMKNFAGTYGVAMNVSSADSLTFGDATNFQTMKFVTATGQNIQFQSGASVIFSGSDALITFNFGQNDIDTRIRGDNDINAFYVNAGTDRVGVGLSAPAAKFHVLIDDAVTNAVTNVQIIDHDSTGTPAVGFGTGLLIRGESSTTAKQELGRLTYAWAEATHATRKAQGKLTVYDTAEREAIRIEASGTAAMLGVLGAAAVARPAAYTLASTATRTMPTPEAAFTGIDNAQVGAVYAQVADLLTLQTRLNNVEGVLRQVIIDLASTSGFGFLAAA